MLKIFASMAAQSSVEASLTEMLRVPFCPPPPPEPPLLQLEPHAMEKNGAVARINPKKTRDVLKFA
jgi:hypothetical protein